MGKMILKRARYFSLFAMLMFLLFSCDEIDSQIPELDVRFSIDLNFYNNLQPGSSIYLPYQGFGGVIVSCLSQGEYYAYDAACTHEISSTCKVESTGLTGSCTCCESQFQLFYTATPIKGPAAAPLKQYNTSLTGNTLLIYN